MSDEHLQVSLSGGCELSFESCDGDWTAGNQHWLKDIKKEKRNSWIEVKILFGGLIKAPNQVYMPEERDLPGKPWDRPWGSAEMQCKVLM